MADVRLSRFRGPALAFCAFLAVQGVSAAVLFVQKLGGSPERVRDFYLGSEATFAAPKTAAGLLEVAVPHLLAIPLVLFVAAHVVGYAGLVRRQVFAVLCGVSFGAALVGLGAGFAVRFLWPGFAAVKVGSFVAFEATLLAWIALLAVTFVRPRADRARATSARVQERATRAARPATSR